MPFVRFSSLRAFLTALLAVLFLQILFASVPAWAGATLYRGREPLGDVATSSGPGDEPWVSIEDTASLLGFKAERNGDELQLTRGGTRLRVVLNAVAAWKDIYLVPLYAAPFEREGRCWMDVPSAVSLFQKTVGTRPADRLRFDVRMDEPAPSPKVRAEEPVPEEREAAKSQVQEKELPKPKPPQESRITVEVEPLGPRAGKVQAEGPDPRAANQEPFETFRPKGQEGKKKHPSLSGGEIQGLRWSNARERIRAVVDCSDGSDPEVSVRDGAVVALFASAVEAPQGLASPYRNVTTSLKRLKGGAELAFVAPDCQRVDNLILDQPRRVVLDFFFESAASIKPLPAAPRSPVPPAPALKKGGEDAEEPARKKSPSRGKPKKRARRLVVVDPGHGGKDIGAPGRKGQPNEKDLTLPIGLALEKALKDRGFDVVMTRRTDVYLTLRERTEIANREGADVFVSVHINSLVTKKLAAGFEIYIMALPTDKDALALAKIENREFVEEKTHGELEKVDRKTELLLRILGDMQQNNKISESTELADALFASGKKGGLPMRRVAQAPFFVLRGAGMPAVLLETGFITNPKEAKLLAHPGYQKRIAESMAEGIVNYLN